MQTSLTRIFTQIILSILLSRTALQAEIAPAPAAEPAVEALPAATSARHRARRDWSKDPSVFLIRVDQPIEQSQLFLFRRSVKRAVAENADALVIQMDTPGGRIDIMREMVNLIIDLEIPTYTLVESDAFSAGAVIALATDHVFMKPRTHIGDAMPVMMGTNGYESLGDAEREKIESAMDAIVRGIAQAKGRDEMLIRAMVRRNLEYKLEDGTVISKAGEILTLTNSEAERLRPDGTPLLSEGTVEDLESMLTTIGLENASQQTENRTWADGLALLITRASPILILLALGLFYMEMNSPGIGWMGASSLILFLIVVYGQNVAGLAGMEDILLIVLGMLLILVELLFIPGFGFVGLLGIGIMMWGLIQSMVIRNPGNPGNLPGFSNFGNVGPAMTTLGLAFIGFGVLLLFFLRNLGESNLFGKKLILATALDTPASAGSGLRALLGCEGRAVTPLSPSGTVVIDGREIDALSDGTYLDAHTTVTVTDISGGRVVVAKKS